MTLSLIPKMYEATSDRLKKCLTWTKRLWMEWALRLTYGYQKATLLNSFLKSMKSFSEKHTRELIAKKIDAFVKDLKIPEIL